jgi:hypothetical protein
MRKSEKKKDFAKLNISFSSEGCEKKKYIKTILFEITHSKFNTLNIILGVFTKISIVPIKIFMTPLRNSSRGLMSHQSSDPSKTSVDQTQSVSWRSVRSDDSPISREINHV